MDGEEDLQDVAEAGYLGVEGQLDHLGMACATGADGLVRRVIDLPAHVARLHASDAFHLQVNGFQAPETASGKGRDFCFGHAIDMIDSVRPQSRRRRGG
jgi:hypothetical protein